MALYRGEVLVGLRLQYKDFSGWQNRFYGSGELKVQEEYWVKRFEGDIPVLNMPTDYMRGSKQDFSGGVATVILDRELTTRCKALVNETETTLNIFLMSVFTILLSKYTGQEDIVVGNGIAGRRQPDLENIIGFFINMLAMRNYPQKHLAFDDYLKQVTAHALEAYNHQDYPFEDLVKKLGLQGNPGRNPLFDFVIQMQNMEIPGLEIPGLTIKIFPMEPSAAHFDLVVYCSEDGEVIRLDFVYAAALFKKSTIEDMAGFFQEITRQVAANRQIKLGDISVALKFADAQSKIRKEEVLFEF